jgi:hypothetical protein
LFNREDFKIQKKRDETPYMLKRETGIGGLRPPLQYGTDDTELVPPINPRHEKGDNTPRGKAALLLIEEILKQKRESLSALRECLMGNGWVDVGRRLREDLETRRKSNTPGSGHYIPFLPLFIEGI